QASIPCQVMSGASATTPPSSKEEAPPWSRSVRLLPGLLQERRHVGPQLRQRLLLLRRQFGQRCPVAQASQVGVLLPVAHLLPHHGAVGGLAALLLLAPQRQVGLEPLQGHLAQARPLLVVEVRRVLTLPGGSQRRVAGCVVAEQRPQVVGQFGL